MEYNRVHSEEIRQLIAVLEGLDEPEAPPIEEPVASSSNDQDLVDLLGKTQSSKKGCRYTYS